LDQEYAPPPRVDVTTPHIARIYDYWLGGKDNFEVDRAAAIAAMQAYPGTAESVRANRTFLARSVRYLVLQAGIRQFLDIGTGIPAASNTHEVAQAAAPECRVVYVDNDPIVLSHARALLSSSPQGMTAYLDADLRDPDKILGQASATLEFCRPVAIMLLGVLQGIGEHDDPYGIVATLMDAVPAGSALTITHPASDIEAEAMANVTARLGDRMPYRATLRNRAEVTRFFDGLTLVDPGVVKVTAWHQDSDLDAARSTTLWCGVAIKG
jgi:hypothetical protein